MQAWPSQHLMRLSHACMLHARADEMRPSRCCSPDGEDLWRADRVRELALQRPHAVHGRRMHLVVKHLVACGLSPVVVRIVALGTRELECSRTLRLEVARRGVRRQWDAAMMVMVVSLDTTG